MNICIVVGYDHHCGAGHYNRMLVLKNALVKRGHIVQIDHLSLCSDIVGGEFDIVIIDVPYEELLVSILPLVNKKTKVVVLENFIVNVDVDLVIKSSVIGKGVINLVNPVFNKYKKDKYEDSVDTILVTQGGSDPFGHTFKICCALEYLGISSRVYVTEGIFFDTELTYNLRRFLNDKMFDIKKMDQKELAYVMSISDIIITAPGQTLMEASTVGVPVITTAHKGRHNDIGMFLHSEDAVCNLGVIHNISNSMFVNNLDFFLGYLYNGEIKKERVANLRSIIKKDCEDIYEEIEGVYND